MNRRVELEVQNGATAKCAGNGLYAQDARAQYDLCSMKFQWVTSSGLFMHTFAHTDRLPFLVPCQSCMLLCGMGVSDNAITERLDV